MGETALRRASSSSAIFIVSFRFNLYMIKKTIQMKNSTAGMIVVQTRKAWTISGETLSGS